MAETTEEALRKALTVIAGRQCGSNCKERYMDVTEKTPNNPRPWVRCSACIAKDALALPVTPSRVEYRVAYESDRGGWKERTWEEPNYMEALDALESLSAQGFTSRRNIRIEIRLVPDPGPWLPYQEEPTNIPTTTSTSA